MNHRRDPDPEIYPVPTLLAGERDAREVEVMCCHCRRWIDDRGQVLAGDPVPMPRAAAISHGLCLSCCELHYGAVFAAKVRAKLHLTKP